MKAGARRWVGVALMCLPAHLMEPAPAGAQNSETRHEQNDGLPVGDPAEPDALPYGFETALHSRYVFRGMAYSHGPASQSTVWLGAGNLSAYFWGNLLLEEEAYQQRFSEVNFGASYTFERGALSIEPAFDRYAYRTRDGLDDPPTIEASVKVSYAVGPVSLFTKHIVDVEVIRGASFQEAGLVIERDISAKTSWTSGFTVGRGSESYNEYYVEVPKAALSYVGFRLSLDWVPTEQVYCSYYGEFTHVPTQAFRDVVESPDIFQFGVVIGFTSQ